MIVVPSLEFGKKYSGLNKKSINIFTVITDELEEHDFVCYLKRTEDSIINEGNNYIYKKDLVFISYIDLDGEESISNIGGYFSSSKKEVLLNESMVYEFLGKCKKHNNIIDVSWDINSLINPENIFYPEGNKNVEKQSLCRVLGIDDSGNRRLKRLGDITSDGCIRPFIYDETLPKFYENRTSIYWKDGPKDEGTVGVWDWTAIPNKSGANNDYVESKYNCNVIPIEIIEVPEVHNIEVLIDHIKKGINSIPTCEKVVFSYRLNNDRFEGVLCVKTMLKIVEEKTYLSEDINSLKVFQFNKGDIFKTKTQQFYKYLRLDDYEKVILTKSPIEIVKNLVLKKASWSVAKQRDMTKADWKMFKSFIDSLVDDSFYQDICKQCDCNEDIAREYFTDFLKKADDVLDSGDMDISVLARVVEHNVKLKSECENIIKEKWIENHKKEIKESEEEITLIKKEIINQNKLLDSINNEIIEKKESLEKLKQDTNYYEEIGEKITKKIEDKLEYAKKHVSDFVGEISFLSSAINSSSITQEKNSIIFETGRNCDGTELTNSYKDSISFISDELAEAGVETHYRDSLATFLYAAYINKFHILLAGPNGESIANALSTALFNRYVGVVDCNCPYDRNSFRSVLNGCDSVIVVKHPFSNGWIYKSIDELYYTDKLIIFINDMSEDLLIEPKSLYNYCFPVFTEFFVDEIPTNNFIGSKKSDDYVELDMKTYRPSYNEYFTSLNLSPFLKNKIQRILSIMHFLNESDVTADYLFIHLAFAYLTDKKDILIDQINRDNNIEKSKRKYMLRFLGDKNE